MSENEKNLLQKAKLGDVEAFEKLIEGCQKKAFNIALRMMGNSEDASELVQEALIRVFKSLKNFKEESAFSTWVYRITTNICLDEIRKRKNKKVIYIDEDIRLIDGEVNMQIQDDGPTPEERIERSEVRKAVKEAISLLPADHRIAVILRDIQGFSYEEIARITQSPEGTVKSRINRARQSLRDILKNKTELFDDYFVK